MSAQTLRFEQFLSIYKDEGANEQPSKEIAKEYGLKRMGTLTDISDENVHNGEYRTGSRHEDSCADDWADLQPFFKKNFLILSFSTTWSQDRPN